ncbi:hypothetical protein L2Y96_04865 [Luteibacter aegosomaticola]|uniref:hypothetical protein n=1 Tax=Luteibacter aegosomaticola TaxID=2911538 RepID=UPI001FF8E0B4|nr:hypothetical protein [Luteibacter aegosomaticola]UPG91114.1 hypothetical protein L2Y96_04865 [Luteibacter aegosomaticola]
MPLSATIILLFCAAVVLPLLGYPLAMATFREPSARRLLWSYPLGLALLLVVARTCATLSSMQAAAWPAWLAMAAWAVVTWRSPRVRTAFANDASRMPPLSAVVILVLVVIAAWGSVFPLAHHGMILFEGTPNHDSIYYVSNARWLVGHAVGEPLVYSPASPAMSVSALAFGPHAKLGRLGSEALLALISAMFRRDPVYLYNAVQTLGIAVASVTALCVLPRRVLGERAHLSPRVLLVMVATMLAPQILQMAVNSNFASLFGTVCLAVLVGASFQARDRWLNPAVFIGSAGAIASYVEEVPIALGVVGAVCLVAWVARERNFRESVLDGCRCGASVLAAAVLLPWISLPGLAVLKSAYFEISSNGAAWRDLYAPFSGARYAYAYLTTSGNTAAHLPAWSIYLGAIALCVGIAAARRRRHDTVFAAGIMLGFGVLTILMFATSYNYGKLKIVEYFAMVLSPAIAALAFHDNDEVRSPWRSGLSGLALLTLCGFNLAGFAGLCFDSAHFAHHKRITRDFVKLAHDTSAVAGDKAVAVRFTESPYFFSMWYAYFSTSPVVFSPEFGAGGYIQSYSIPHPFAPFESAPFGVSETTTWQGVSHAFKPLVRRGSYAAVRMEDVQSISFEGNYGNEGTWFWMGPELRINVSARGARQIRVSVRDRFAPTTPNENVRISLDHASCVVSVPSQHADLIIDLPSTPKQTLVIDPTGPARSPLDVGLSGDTRKLTYRVSDVSLAAPGTLGHPTCELH